MSEIVVCPTPITKNGRKYFLHHRLENYKRALAGMPLIDESSVSILEFVPAAQAASELGASRRTLGRDIKAAAANADADQGRAA